MNPTNIEWVKNPDGTQGFTWNPITGCLNHTNGLCKGGNFPCYAYKLAHGRLRQNYLLSNAIQIENDQQVGKPKSVLLEGSRYWDLYNPFYPRFWHERLFFDMGSNPKGIFVCDMGELFGNWIPEQWVNRILWAIKARPNNRFYILTKQLQNILRWSPFPENCWVGITATNGKYLLEALETFPNIKASVKFISIEPMLGEVKTDYVPNIQNVLGIPFPWWQRIDWLIIGACTGSKTEMSGLIQRYPELTVMPYANKWTAQPRIKWVREIVETADRVGIPVFLKDSLSLLLPSGYGCDYNHWAYRDGKLRQEFPLTKPSMSTK